jgi:hypothetical protein
MKQTQAIPRKDKMLYRVVDWTADSMFLDKFVEDVWLDESEVAMLILKGRDVKLIKSQ